MINNKQGSRNHIGLGTAELKGTLGPQSKIKVISADNPSIVGDYTLILFKIAFSMEAKTSKQQQQQQKIISVKATPSATIHPPPPHAHPLCSLVTLLKSHNSPKREAGGMGGAKVGM